MSSRTTGSSHRALRTRTGEEAAGCWHGRSVRVILALCSLLLAAGLGLHSLTPGPAPGMANLQLSVIVEDPGIAAGRMEREITLPLEHALAHIEGVSRIHSRSELGRARVELGLSPGADRDTLYLAVRGAVERARLGFPQSARKPYILSGTADRRPIFILSVSASGRSLRSLRSYLEQEVKPGFARIPGTGEVVIGGGAPEELRIAIDPAKASRSGIPLRLVAQTVASHSRPGSVGSLKRGNFELPLLLSGAYTSLRELRHLPIPLPQEATLALGHIAEVTRGSRDARTVSRVDGNRRIVLYVRSDGTTSSLLLSRALRAHTAALKQSSTEDYTVIFDRGAEAEKAFLSLLRALCLSVAMVILAMLCGCRAAPGQAVLLGTLPAAVLLCSAGLLGGAGLAIDTFVLTGLTVGIGSVADNGIILHAQLSGRRTPLGAAISAVTPVLICSTATSLIALAPLLTLQRRVAGVMQIVCAIALLLLSSLTISLLFLPTLLAAAPPAAPRSPRRRSLRHRTPLRRTPLLPSSLSRGPSASARGVHLLYRALACAYRHPGRVAGAAGLSILSGILCLLNLGIDFDRTVSTSSIFVHLECESGTALASVDEKILCYQRSIRRLPGIERIESQARRESGNLTVAFDPRAISRSALTAMLKRRAAGIPGAHIHIPRTSGEGELALRVTLTGDQISRLKEHAETAATALARCQEVSATVLHFKSNPPVLRFTPDLSAAAAHNLSPARIASHLQWTLQGPVAAKWITEGREMDIRLFGRCEAPQSKAGLRDLRIPRRNAPSMALMELGAITEEFPPSPIGRWNRKRAVSFSLLFPGLTAVEAAALVWAELDRLPLPTGYAYHIDKRVFELERECRLLGRLLLLAVLLIYMLLASRFESLLIPVPVLAILPTSLALPAIALGCAGRVVTVPTLIGFIILCGMAVNSSQLLVEEIRRYQRKGLQDWQAVRSAVRRRFSPLSLTTVTTLLAILPLFFITHNPVTAAMALVMFWGTLGAFFSTIIVLPPLCAHLPGLAPETQGEAPGDIRHVSGKEPPS